MKKAVALLLVVLCLVFCACQEDDGNKISAKDANVTDLTEGVVARNVTPLQDPSADASDFCFNLFRSCYSASNNTLISPLSVLCALAMTANGADGNTKAQMEEVLGGETGQLNDLLYTYAKSLEKEDGKMRMANSIWFKQSSESFTADPDFLQLNADYYGAGLYEAVFDEATRKAINKWVEDNTAGKIKKILENMDEDAVMYLVNALYFNANWVNQYYDGNVQDSVFTKENGETKSVKIMNSTENIYFSDEMCTGTMKPFEGGRYVFAAFLPREGITMSDFVAAFSAERFNTLYETRQIARVITGLLKFDTYYNMEMSEVLQGMGMTDAFMPMDADFSKLGKVPEGDNIYINRVIHKTFMSVNEKGTEAAAATVVEMNKATSAGPQKESVKYVILDRPFIYMILDTETMLPVFLGSYLG